MSTLVKILIVILVFCAVVKISNRSINKDESPMGVTTVPEVIVQTIKEIRPTVENSAKAGPPEGAKKTVTTEETVVTKTETSTTHRYPNVKVVPFGWIQVDSPDPKKVRYVAGSKGAKMTSTQWVDFERSVSPPVVYNLKVVTDPEKSTTKLIDIRREFDGTYTVKDTNGTWGPLGETERLKYMEYTLEIGFSQLNGHPVKAAISFVPEPRPGNTERPPFPEPPVECDMEVASLP